MLGIVLEKSLIGRLLISIFIVCSIIFGPLLFEFYIEYKLDFFYRFFDNLYFYTGKKIEYKKINEKYLINSLKIINLALLFFFYVSEDKYIEVYILINIVLLIIIYFFDYYLDLFVIMFLVILYKIDFKLILFLILQLFLVLSILYFGIKYL